MAFKYVPTNWVNKKTQLNEDNMNKIEEALARLAEESGGIQEILEGPGITATSSVDGTKVIVGLKRGSSDNNLLILDPNNGLFLTLNMSYDLKTRTLNINNGEGNGWSQSVQFDVDKAIVDGNYDPETRNLVFDLSDASQVVVDMSKLRPNWTFLNSKTMTITEDQNEEGLTTFKLDVKLSEDETNELVIKDDGLYSERLDWNLIGVSKETDGRWEFEEEIGNVYWHFESSNTVQVDNFELQGKKGSLKYFNFSYRISTESGNVLEIRDGKIVAPDLIEEAALRLELDRLNEMYSALRHMKYKESDTVKFTYKFNQDNEGYLEAKAKISEHVNNELIMDDFGIKFPPYTPGPGKPDLTPFIERLEEMEKEYPRSGIEVDYLMNNAKI